MKKLLSILMVSSVLVFSSCDKDEIKNTDTKVGRSDVTVYPILTLKGQTYMTVPVGGTWTDPGVDAKEGTATIQYTTAGTVNKDVAGVYRLVYTAKNKDGFAASATRWVAVYSTDATAQNNDLSGNYLRAATGVTNTWTKLAPGVYRIDNPGGAAGTNLTAILFNQTGLTIKIPSQITNDGNTTSSSTETYTLTPAPATYSMIILNPGYGTGLRTFVKQ